jgi:tripartite ATP-independent transporter DctM subunit
MVVLPLFLIMGEFAVHARMGEELYAAARVWLGRFHGGLAMATAAGSAFFSMVTGVSLASTTIFTKIALPEMRKANYKDILSTAVIASSGTLSVLIPPSGMMIMYCMITGASLGKLMLGGFIPGAVTAAAFALMIYFRARLNPELGPPVKEKPTFIEMLLALRWLGTITLVAVLMFGGIYFGVFSPSEAGAIGAFLTFVIALYRRTLSWEKIGRSLYGTVKVTGMVFFIIVGGIMFGKFLALSGITMAIFEFFVSLSVPPVIVLTLVMVGYLILGCIMPANAMLVLTLPIVYPLLVDGFGYDPTLLGILCICQVEIASITPPLGMGLITVNAIAGDVRLEEIIRGIWPFLIVNFLLVALFIMFPVIVLWLPQTMF